MNGETVIFIIAWQSDLTLLRILEILLDFKMQGQLLTQLEL
jgi:hypothetical protein